MSIVAADVAKMTGDAQPIVDAQATEEAVSFANTQTMGKVEDLVRRYGIDSMGATQLAVARVLHAHLPDPSVRRQGSSALEPIRKRVSHVDHTSALAYVTAILRNARESFDMVTGSDRTVSVLRGEFETALRQLAHSGGKARAIVLGKNASGFISLQEEFPETLRVVFAQQADTRPVRHFMVNDRRMSREEDPHGPLTDQPRAQSVSACFYGYDDAKASSLKMTMDAYWQTLTGEAAPDPAPRRRWFRWWPLKQ